MTWLFLSIFILFFLLHFGWTQKIYSHNYLQLLFVFSIILPFVVYLMVNKKNKTQLTSFALIIFFTVFCCSL
jgi:hypothetical protein